MSLIKALILLFFISLNSNNMPNYNKKKNLDMKLKKLNWWNVKFNFKDVTTGNAKSFITV